MRKIETSLYPTNTNFLAGLVKLGTHCVLGKKVQLDINTITPIYHDTNIATILPYHEHHTTLRHNITASPGCDQDHQQGEAQRIRSTKGRPEKRIYQLFQ